MKNLFKRLGTFLGVSETAVAPAIAEEAPKPKAPAKKPAAKKTTTAKKSAPKHKKQ